MRALFLVLIASLGMQARADTYVLDTATGKVRLARGEEAAPEAPKIKPSVVKVRDDAVSRWTSQPLNVGSCPCKATGGCHCQPYSECARGTCASHNLLLSKAAAQPVRAAEPQPAPIPVQTFRPAVEQQCPT